MDYVFQLSGEDLKLSKLELKALFEAYGLKFAAKQKKNIIFIKTKATEKQICQLCKRSALLKWCSLVMKPDFSWVKPPFAVRIEQGKRNIKEIASKIWKKLKNPSVDLENPKTTVYVVNNLFTKLIWKKEKGRFVKREPIKKPAFHPTSLKPKWARLVINLSRCKEKEVLLDPFCGTGSVLIEAAVIGCKAIGSDLDKEMVTGTKKNLAYYKLKAKVKQANALELEKHYKSVDAIATDPPYGRSSHIGAKNIKELYEGFLKSAHKILKKGKYCVLFYPHYIKFKIPKRWKLIDKASIYVHGGLTRKIIVLKKI